MILLVFQLAFVSCPHPEEEHARKDPTYTLRMLNPETRATLEALREEEKGKKTVSHGKGELQYLYILLTAHTLYTQEKKESKGKEKATSRNAVSWQLIVFLSSLSPLTLPLTLPSSLGPLLYWCCRPISDLHCQCSSHRK